ncbi:MAG: rhodanese-like domain-containing protein, partial [Coleofasciculus sp.]
MSDPQTTNPIAEAKESVNEAIPTPPPQQMPESSAQALKSRLQWGEPALTILDVRDRDAFNQARITGAIPMPMEELTDRAISSLEPQREIYVYGDNDQQSNQAASQLREA